MFLKRKNDVEIKALLEQAGIDGSQYPHYHKWIRYYFDFCRKYESEPQDSNTLAEFLEKLKEKKQERWKRKQAQHAVQIVTQGQDSFFFASQIESENRENVVEEEGLIQEEINEQTDSLALAHAEPFDKKTESHASSMCFGIVGEHGGSHPSNKVETSASRTTRADGRMSCDEIRCLNSIRFPNHATKVDGSSHPNGSHPNGSHPNGEAEIAGFAMNNPSVQKFALIEKFSSRLDGDTKTITSVASSQATKRFDAIKDGDEPRVRLKSPDEQKYLDTKGLCQGTFHTKTAEKEMAFGATDTAMQNFEAEENGHETEFLGGEMTWPVVYRLLESAIQIRHYSSKTLKSYKGWAYQLELFSHHKAPNELSHADISAFLNHLAIHRRVSAASQNLAFNALLFVFKHVLQKDFGNFSGVIRAKRTQYVPVILSRDEVYQLFSCLCKPFDLIAMVLYGCGLRLSEGLNLRVQDIDFDNKMLIVRNGKGKKDRYVPLPQSIFSELQSQFQYVLDTYEQDKEIGYDGVFLHGIQYKKSKNAAKELIWQWFFPADHLTQTQSGELRRYHVHESSVQKAIKNAAYAAKIPKRVTPHILRHSFASHLLQANFDIRTIQQLLGHNHVNTTMIYTHTVKSNTKKNAQSPLDF